METERRPEVGETVLIDNRRAEVLRVNTQRRTVDARLTRKRNPVTYIGRPWRRIEYLADKE